MCTFAASPAFHASEEAVNKPARRRVSGGNSSEGMLKASNIHSVGGRGKAWVAGQNN